MHIDDKLSDYDQVRRFLKLKPEQKVIDELQLVYSALAKISPIIKPILNGSDCTIQIRCTRKNND